VWQGEGTGAKKDPGYGRVACDEVEGAGHVRLVRHHHARWLDASDCASFELVATGDCSGPQQRVPGGAKAWSGGNSTEKEGTSAG
jgi:hypothetical protein